MGPIRAEGGRYSAHPLSRLAAAALLAVLGFALSEEEPHPGRAVYERVCAACHQAEGEGIEGVYPTLADNDVVAGNPRELAAIPLNGRAAMPAFGSSLSDQEIADVLSYVRTSWGNDAEPITANLVAEVRSATGAGPGPGEAAADEDEGDATEFAYEDRGEQVYQRNCAACHQEEGQGIPGVYPALAGNGFVQADAGDVVAVPLDGRAGMPAFGGELSNEDLAAVVSYIRNSWGNEGSIVTPDDVAAVRAGDAPGEEGGDADDGSGGDPLDRPGAAN